MTSELVEREDTRYELFDELESEVRTYCRRFPAIFERAEGSLMWDNQGREYVDFMSGAGALNYGHNHPVIRNALLDYLRDCGPVHALDLYTSAKAELLRAFRDVVLAPRGLSYRLQFTGPTGTNAVEAALKTARRVTGRTGVIAFTGGFHGLSLGALATSANRVKRGAAGVPLEHVFRAPYDGYLGENLDTLAYLEQLFDDPSGGLDKPAAIIVETVQGEGGLASASEPWLRRLAALAREHGVVLILDDIQTGCGRTGTFFSFEPMGIEPDIVCLSKSVSGYGLPMALTLIRPEYDQLGPGEHSGTFRGHNLAFVAGRAALHFWTRQSFSTALRHAAEHLDRGLSALLDEQSDVVSGLLGRGMIRGITFQSPIAEDVSRMSFDHGLLVETSGGTGRVLKIMPSLVAEPDLVDRGLKILRDAITRVGV